MVKEPEAPIRVAVIGVGSFGRNHARVYRELANEQAQAKAAAQAAAGAGAGSDPERAAPKPSPPVELAAVVDCDRARAQAVAAEFGAQAYFSLEELLADGRVHAASVAVPTVRHLPVARALMQAGIDVLVEKPLALNVAEADALIELAQRHQRVAQAGHLERFNPAVRAALPYITRPMFFEVHRLSVFTPRSLDVDVVMDLMIHDLDVVLSLVNSPVREIRAVGLPVLTPKVDIANVRVEFESGCVANFTASRVSTEKVRKLRFFQPHQYVSLDYSRRDMFMLTVKPPGESHGDGTQFALPQIVPSKPQVPPEEPLKAELRSFLESVASRARPIVPLEDGRRALELALQIRSQIEKHSLRAGVADLRQW